MATEARLLTVRSFHCWVCAEASNYTWQSGPSGLACSHLSINSVDRMMLSEVRVDQRHGLSECVSTVRPTGNYHDRPRYGHGVWSTLSGVCGAQRLEGSAILWFVKVSVVSEGVQDVILQLVVQLIIWSFSLGHDGVCWKERWSECNCTSTWLSRCQCSVLLTTIQLDTNTVYILYPLNHIYTFAHSRLAWARWVRNKYR